MKRTVFVLAAVIIGVLSTISQAQDSDNRPIVLRGATTVESLIAPWVKEFAENNRTPGIDLKGSFMGEGFRALLERRADILMAARELTEDEKRLAANRGVNLRESFLTNDAVAIVVNPANPINELSLEQLTKLWNGEYSNWKQVGGADEPVSLCVSSPDSAMRQFLEKVILKTSASSTATVIPDASGVVLPVMTRKGGLAYCRTDRALKGSQDHKLKCLALKKDANSGAVVLSAETIRDGSFPIIRPLLLIVDNNTAREPVKNLVEFCVNKASQGSQTK